MNSAAETGPVMSVPPQAVAQNPPPPPAPSLPDLVDLLDELIDALEGAQAVIGDQRGPLGTVDALLVAVQIDLSELLLNTVLVSGYPGSIDTSVSPTDLNEYAAAASSLVQDALDEASAGGDVDYDLIGSHLKTALHLITRTSPHNYRTKAGI